MIFVAKVMTIAIMAACLAHADANEHEMRYEFIFMTKHDMEQVQLGSTWIRLSSPDRPGQSRRRHHQSEPAQTHRD